MKRLYHTELALAEIEHPPTPDAMQQIASALLWDGRVDRANDVANSMLDHFMHDTVREAYRAIGDGDIRRADWGYWMGFRCATNALDRKRRASRRVREVRS